MNVVLTNARYFEFDRIAWEKPPLQRNCAIWSRAYASEATTRPAKRLVRKSESFEEMALLTIPFSPPPPQNVLVGNYDVSKSGVGDGHLRIIR